MKENDRNQLDIEIDYTVLWKKKWIILACGVLAALIAYFGVAVLVPPSYSSTIMLYVNNHSSAIESSLSLTSADISAARSIVDTLVVIFQNSDVLDKVAEETDVDYTGNQLRKMVDAGAEGKTEVMYITVTTHDAEEAAKIADSIAQLLPDKISTIIDNTSTRIVKEAKVESKKVAPNLMEYGAIGLVAGLALSSGVVILLSLLNNVVQDTDFLINTYNVPLLGEIPNLNGRRSKGYYSKSKYGYGYGYGYGQKPEKQKQKEKLKGKA